MRILAVIDSFRLGGAETQLAELLNVFAEKHGHECLVCSLLPPQTQEVVFSKSVKRFYFHKTSRLSLARITFQLARIIGTYRPDVAYSRLQLANGITRIASYLPGCRVRHVAGIDAVPEALTAPWMRGHSGNVVFRWLEQFADQILCNSEGTARAVLKHGYSPSRVRVVYNGIDVERFRPLDTRKPDERAQLVCVATLRPEKGVERLIRLLAPILGEGRALLSVVGDGPERPAVQHAIDDLRLTDAVRLLGAREDVLPVLQNSDIYVSAAQFEGFGISVAEAAAAGIPAVCMAAPGGLDEVVLHGSTGYLIPENEQQAFSDAVGHLCADARLRVRMGTAARTHVVRHFSLDEIAVRLEQYLHGT